ncbi:hypothetical protein [Hydrocarboniphaga effusa]|uniref:hypothetical protein n=1 Tax=Hydrocarboniphaga effusa TaxID=243629 RepID=UPI003BA8ED2D
MKGLFRHIRTILEAEGPKNFEGICARCDDTPNVVRVMVERLMTEERIHTLQIDGETIYAPGSPNRPRNRDAVTEAKVERDTIEKLQSDIIDCLRIRPASDELLREKVCCASQSRWQRAIRSLLYVRQIEGNASQYRLAGMAVRRAA